MKVLVTLFAIFCVVAQAASATVVAYDGKSYQVSIDKNKLEVSISEINVDSVDQATEPSDVVENHHDEEKRSVDIPNKDIPLGGLTSQKKIDPTETKYSGSYDKGMGTRNELVLSEGQRKKQRIAAFKKQLAAGRGEEFSKGLIDDTEITIRDFSKTVHKSLEQLRQRTLNNPDSKLAVEDVILAEAIGRAIAERIDSIVFRVNEGKIFARTSNDFFMRYRDLSDLKRVEDALDIVSFSEKALQAMGEL